MHCCGIIFDKCESLGHTGTFGCLLLSQEYIQPKTNLVTMSISYSGTCFHYNRNCTQQILKHVFSIRLIIIIIITYKLYIALYIICKETTLRHFTSIIIYNTNAPQYYRIIQRLLKFTYIPSKTMHSVTALNIYKNINSKAPEYL